MTPSPTPLPADAPQDLRPLIALYNSTNGPNWRNNDNWLTDRPLYEWFGLRVNIDGRVTGIHLGGNLLKGSLPPELGELDQLQELGIADSNLTGVIPRELGRLTQLQELVLEENDLTGPIPHEIGLLPELRYLDLSDNNLSGEIPPSLMESESLEDIDLGNNTLTGSIPSEISTQSQIGYLRLSGNQLTGEIPPGIAQLQDLVGFSASNNQLTGHLPDWFARFQRLQQLDIDSNQLTGTIPEDLVDLELYQLSIAGNDFSGCVPGSLRDVRFNNIPFANIPVCDEPERAELIVPRYVKLAIADAANSAETLAAQLATQWLNDFIESIGWPTPENTITVFVDRQDGLVRSYSDYVDGCDQRCALYAIERRQPDPRYISGAVFVRTHGSEGNALELLAERTAREIFTALQLEVADRLDAQGLRRYPRWWTYGLSTFIGAIAVADGTGQSRDDIRQEIVDWVADAQFHPLWEHEERGNWSNYQPRRALATDLLASQVGLRKLTEFYTERTDGEDWRQTFQRVFNISVPDFYERFNQHHRDGYPLRPLPLEGSTQWP